MTIDTYTSGSGVSQADVDNSIQNLRIASPLFNRDYNTVTANTRVLIVIADDPDSTDPNQPANSPSPHQVVSGDLPLYQNYDWVVWLPKQAFDGDTYNGGVGKWSLERLVSHELTHVLQQIGVGGAGTDADREEEATKHSDDVMKQAAPAEAQMGHYYNTPGNPASGHNYTWSYGDSPHILNPNTPVPFPNISPLPNWVPGVTSPFALGEAAVSPLVLDLGTGGIQLTALNSTGSVYWDIDQDGFREASGWIAGNTALLAIDKNSDGAVNNNGELFGNDATYANGFANLAQYDSNSDGHITSADTHYGDLIVWTDDNHDGYSQANELHTLSSLSITDISLTYALSSATINGNDVKQTGTFTMGGVSHAMADVWFAYDDVNTIYNEDYTLDIRTLFMPDIRGFGVLPDLHIAMSIDNTGTGNLLSLVEDISTKSLSELLSPSNDLKGELTDILYRWAGVDGISPTSRGAYANAQQLEFLEAFVGHSFQQTGSNPPGVPSVDYLNAAWREAIGAIGGHLLIQTSLGGLFGDPVYDVLSDSFSNPAIQDGGSLRFTTAGVAESINGTALNDVYLLHAGDSPTTSGQETIYETANNGMDTVLFGGIDPDDVRAWTDSSSNLYIQYTATDTLMIYGYGGGSTNVVSNYVEHIAFDDGTVWDLTQGLHLADTDSAHTLYGSAQADRIDGRGGNDSIYGYGGNDILSGGTGADTLTGGTGDDTYVFSAGDGADTIIENTSAGTDTISMSGFDAGDVRFYTDTYGYLHIDSRANNNDNISVQASYTSASGTIYELAVSERIEQIVYGDDTSLLLNTGLPLEGTSSGETLYGTQYNDTIKGMAGNDMLYGNRGDDILGGGTGTDTLTGGTGDDTYIFAAGDGTDSVIENTSAGADTIKLIDYGVGDIRLYVDAYSDLHIESRATSSDAVLFHIDYTSFAGTTYEVAAGQRIEQIVFSDNTVWSLNAGLPLEGTSSGDNLYGTQYNDTIKGMAGDDYLYGNRGDDVLSGGSGINYLYGGADADIFAFDAISSTNNVQDFSVAQSDKLDVSALLHLYNPLTDAITDFVQITTSGSNSLMSVDVDGLGGAYGFQQIATIFGVTGLTDEAALATAGTLIV